jgi:hypothetical protein
MDKDMFWVDRHARIVIRGRRAVSLSILQFAIFDALHRAGTKNGKQLGSHSLLDTIYHGVREPSNLNTVHGTVIKLNQKLRYLGLKVRGVNQREHSFYQIVPL